MSGGEKKRKGTRSQGWEEAGAEFYQESYPGDGDIESLWKDPNRLATLLPSKQTRAVAATIRLRTQDTRTNKSTVRRYATGRSRRDSTRRTSTIGGDVHVSMLPDLSEMRSNEETAWEEIMMIKEKPIPMARKRGEKDHILSQQHLRLQGLENFNWKWKKAWRSFMAQLSESFEKVELWRGDLKNIEGHFGTGVVAFFRFIKWLLFLNLAILLLVVLFIVLPTILLNTQKPTCTNPNEEEYSCDEKYYCNINGSNVALSIVQGTGILETSLMFYGMYPNATFTYHIFDVPMYFNLPLAYLLVTLVYLLMSLIVIVRTGAKGFREKLLQNEGQFYQYSNLVFGGWDYCIQNEKSARNKHKAIYNELRTLLEEERLTEERHKQDKWRIFFLRCLVNTIVLAILTLSAGAIYFVFNYSITIKPNDGPKVLQLLYEFLPSLCIVALNITIPFIFKFLQSYEHYSPLTQIRMALVRTVFLRLASLVVFYASMYLKIDCGESEAPLTECSRCSAEPDCWETFVGQQIYKLLLTDFAIQLMLTFLVNFLRALLARHVHNRFVKFIGEQNFDLSRHALDVVYTQTLCWVGIFFAPLISLMAVVMFFILFYVKKFACLVNSKPNNVVYRASKSTSLFMVVMLVSYPVALIPIGFTISTFQPSASCGPFKSLGSIWSLVEQTFNLFPDVIQSIAGFLITPGFGIPLFVLLILLLYYYTAVNSANRHMVRVLKNQLVLEGHDKKFLIDRLLMFIRQEKRMRMMCSSSRNTDQDTLTNASSIQS
ncbi:hypothetical protein ABEB36_001855 [Hypothenemus hampei]|uniref:TMC domain-containing protein n=1 Tax=Hypothenemus hampei TaxID=57062 RepID=A0ABD1FFY2_HYPHA